MDVTDKEDEKYINTPVTLNTFLFIVSLNNPKYGAPKK